MQYNAINAPREEYNAVTFSWVEGEIRKARQEKCKDEKSRQEDTNKDLLLLLTLFLSIVKTNTQRESETEKRSLRQGRDKTRLGRDKTRLGRETRQD
jgi:hypothetical protein